MDLFHLPGFLVLLEEKLAWSLSYRARRSSNCSSFFLSAFSWARTSLLILFFASISYGLLKSNAVASSDIGLSSAGTAGKCRCLIESSLS